MRRGVRATLAAGVLAVACGARSSLVEPQLTLGDQGSDAGLAGVPDASSAIDGPADRPPIDGPESDGSDDGGPDADGPRVVGSIQWIVGEVYALGISGDGTTVVGFHTSPAHPNLAAFRWTSSFGIEDIGGDGSVASAANSDGSVIVGGVADADAGRIGYYYEPAVWRDSPPGFSVLAATFGMASGISADGRTIVGALPYDPVPGFRWSASSGVQAVPGVGATMSSAVEVSGDGSTIVGIGEGAHGLVATRWTSTTGSEVLSISGGWDWSGASGTNADGTVVVGAVHWYATYRDLGFVWTAPGPGQVLAQVPGLPLSTASKVNADGRVIVGQSCHSLTSCSGGATVWRDGQPSLVSDVLTSLAVDLAGGDLENAVGVSFDGKVIVGNGRPPGGGMTGIWVARLP
jgi:uncharacterized membrane protein